MSAQCRCPDPNHGANPFGTSLPDGVEGNWRPLSDARLKANIKPNVHELKQCECGCNTYQGTSNIGPTDVDSLDIPVLPLTLDYEDDDAPSDDHEYVSIKATEYAELLNKVRSAESST